MRAIVPGSYDPVTVGHLDIIRRAAEMHDEVYAVVFINPNKKYTFDTNQRVDMLRLATAQIGNVTVGYSDGLVIDYMREHGIDVIVKGYRNDTDLTWEKEQADWNLRHGGYDTLLLKCRDGLESVSSTAVRNRISGGEIPRDILHPDVREYIEGLGK